MKNKLIATLVLSMLLISTIPFMLDIKPVEASITGPSLIVDDINNRVTATRGIKSGSVLTCKGTATNLGGESLTLMVGYFGKEIGGMLTNTDGIGWWSPDGVTWYPAPPFTASNYLDYQIELINGPIVLPIGASLTTYIKFQINRDVVNPVEVLIVFFKDVNVDHKLTVPPDIIVSSGDFPVKLDISIWKTVELGTSTPKFFNTIQGAINAASPSDTIIVYDGSYNENLVVNKALTIKTASKPIIDGGAAGNCISIGANNVVISGFEIRNGYNGIVGQTSGSTFSNNIIHDNLNIPGSAGVGILLWGDNDNNIITGNTIYDNDRQGIFIGYYDTTYISTGNIISYNTIYNNGLYRYANGPDASDYGIQLWTADNNVIEYNEIYGHDDWFPWGGTFDFAQAIYLCDSDSNFVTNNYLHDNNYGVGLWHPSRPVVTNFINYNNIVGNTGYGVCTFDGSPAVDARFNWWGDASGPTHSSNLDGSGDVISNYVDYSPWLGDTFETTPRTYHVNLSGAPGAIQEAVNAASSGDTIIVHDGTYDEQVVIDKSLTIQGTGSTPVIKPSSAAKLTTILSGCYWGGTKQIAGIIVANVADGSDVTVKNLIVDGENVISKPATADYVTGIFYRETGGLIDTITIANMTIDATGTSVRGYGIYLSALVNTVSVEIKDCNITNFDKNGVNAHGNKLTTNIHDNTVIGRGPLPSGDEVQNGIVIMDSAIGIVNNNIISDMEYVPETWWTAGILLLDGGSGCTANYNIINDCQIGIVFNDMSGSAAHNTISGGTVGKAGLILQQSWGTGTWAASFTNNILSGCDVEGIGVHSYDEDTSLAAIIDSNQLDGGLGNGIVIGDIPDYSPAGNITVIITNNNISDWRLGIHLASSVIGATITGNRIIDFIKGGIVTRSAKNIFIEGNDISTTIHDEAPNGIDIGTYSGTNGIIKGNEISGCSWSGFGGDYETSWSGSGILVIESGDCLKIMENNVHDCDVGMDIESDSANITFNEVYDNAYGFVFWNANPKVNYNNIYNNIQYGVYRTAMGNPAGVLDARYNWWGSSNGPYHPMLNPEGLGDRVSDNVNFIPWLPLVHDVAVIDVTASPTTVAAGETVTINVKVENQGSDYESFTVTVYYDGTAIASQNVINLLPNWDTTLTFYWDTTGMPRGNYTIKAQASSVLGEIDLADNVFVDGTVEVLWHDVAVVNIVCNRTWVYQGHSVSINVTVRNEGDYPETVTVTLYYNITANKKIGTQVIDLLSGETQTVIFVWNTVGVEYCHNYTITAVASIAYPDADPTDNTLADGKVKVRILGDVNGDGIVDVVDISIQVDAFLAELGHPRWNPDADLDHDRIIDLADVSITIDHFLDECP